MSTEPTIINTSETHDDAALGRRAILAGVGLIGAAAMASRAAAGPLNPPAGAVASTPGPEPRTPVNATNTPGNASFLFRITQPGSYYLTGNITAAAGYAGNGIEIAADNVTLDLMGFSIIGPGTGVGHGIARTSTGPVNCRLINGSASSWGGNGVQMFSSIRAHIENMTLSNNGGSGCSVNTHSRIINCIAGNNGGSGFSIGIGSNLSGCHAHNNGGNGYNAAPYCAYHHCSAYQNAFNGFALSSASVVNHCMSGANATNGFSCGTGCVFTGCTAYLNTINGFLASTQGSLCDACSGSDNSGDGFNGPLLLSGCNAYSNDGNGFDGVHVSTGSNSAGNTLVTVINGAPAPVIADTRAV